MKIWIMQVHREGSPDIETVDSVHDSEEGAKRVWDEISREACPSWSQADIDEQWNIGATMDFEDSPGCMWVEVVDLHLTKWEIRERT